MKKLLLLTTLAVISANAFAYDDDEQQNTFKLRIYNGSDNRVEVTCDDGETSYLLAPDSYRRLTFLGGEDLYLSCDAHYLNGRHLETKTINANHARRIPTWRIKHHHHYNR